MSATPPLIRLSSPRGRSATSLAARARTSSVSSSSRQGTATTLCDVDLGNRALVGDREHPHLADLVTPELHAHRVLGGRREDVEDAAADGELAALADHVDPRVGQFHQAGPAVESNSASKSSRLRRPDLQRHRLDGRPHRGPSAAAATARWSPPPEAAARAGHRRGGPAGAAASAGCRRCRPRVRAARAAASPRTGTSPPRRRRRRAARRSGRRPRGRWPSPPEAGHRAPARTRCRAVHWPARRARVRRDARRHAPPVRRTAAR